MSANNPYKDALPPYRSTVFYNLLFSISALLKL